MNVFLLPAVFIFVWSSVEGSVGWMVRLLALVPLGYILVQGSLYWHLKVRSVADGTTLPDYFPGLFHFFKLSNTFALGIPLVVLLVALLSKQASPADVAWSGGLIAFAALEHVNYYVYQLMHDTVSDLKYLVRHRRLRRAPLAEDLHRSPHTSPKP